MKKRTKVLYSILTLIVLIAIGAFIFINNLKNSALPDYQAEIELYGLIDKVEVIRDDNAVPHIYAKNESDLYKVTGYVLAQDRLWQMDLLRRVTQGRLSEIFGEDMIDSDILLRSLRMTEKSEYVMETSPKEVISALESFVDGINQYIDQNNQLPFEFRVLGYKPEKWKKEDITGLIGYMSWDLKTAWDTEILLYKIKSKLGDKAFNELLPNLNMQQTAIFENAQLLDTTSDNTFLSANKQLSEIAPEVFSASNNWAISPEKSSTNKAILCNDMHLGLNIPGVWYQIHQTVEGKFSVSGVLLPGQPFVVAGHNENIAWGLTNVMLDGTDFYIESINPENPNQYLLDGKYRDLNVKTELIKVKGQDQTVEKTLKFTHRGPIISEFKKISEHQISMRWVGNENSNEVIALYKLNRARNNSEFLDAVKDFKAIAQNFAYADIEGNIGIYMCGGIPIRAADGYNIFPGDTSKYDWKGLLPFDSLPKTYNPENGYIYSANNKSVDSSFNHYISQWFAMPHRANRIIQLLEVKDKLSVEDMQRIQTDITSYLAMKMTPEIISNIEEDKLNENAKTAFNILKEWDYSFEKEKVAPTIFDVLYLQIVEDIYKDELGELIFNDLLKAKYLVNSIIDELFESKKSMFIDNISTENKESFQDILTKALNTTANRLAETYSGIENAKWEKPHKLKLEHPMGSVKILDKVLNLNRNNISVDGSYHTVSPHSYSLNNPFLSTSGASHRHIFTFENLDNSKVIIPTGQSGIPGSDYYCNQTDNYINSKYNNHNFTKTAVKKADVNKALFLVKY